MRARLISLALLLPACDEEAERRRFEAEAWNAPCHDESVLLATTAGSPNSFRCPNKSHHMRVQVATRASNEEAAALVFCECVRPGGLADAAAQ